MLVLLDTDRVYSVVVNFLVRHSVCGRKWSCWTMTVIVYRVVGNGLVGLSQ